MPAKRAFSSYFYCSLTEKKLFTSFLFHFHLFLTRKCMLHGHILAPPEGLRAPELPGVNPWGQLQKSGVIPRSFKRKKIVSNGRTNGLTN